MMNFGKISKVFVALDGMFTKCYLEPALHGWSLFDINGEFVGMIAENGFALDSKYRYANKIIIELSNRGVTIFDFYTWQVVLHQEEVDKAIME